MSIPTDLWEWALSQPQGASALVRELLERERARRSSAFFEHCDVPGRQAMEVTTPHGNVTALEVADRGILLLRDDESSHFFSYIADAEGWRYGFGEDAMREIVHGRPHPPKEVAKPSDPGAGVDPDAGP